MTAFTESEWRASVMHHAREALTWRRRALAAEEAVRQLVGWTTELDPEPGPPAEYVTGRAVGAVRQAMRNSRRSRRRIPPAAASGGDGEGTGNDG